MGVNLVDTAVTRRTEKNSSSSLKINLSKAALAKIKAPEKGKIRIWDTEQKSLYVILPSSGKAVAYFRYRLHSCQRDFRLGRLDRLSIKAIRDTAKKVSAMVELGRDPQMERMEKKQQIKEAKRKESNNSFKTLGNFYYKYYIDHAKAHLKDHETRLRVIEYNFSHWFEWPMEELSVSVVSQWRNQKMNTPIVHGKGENRTERKRSPGGVNRPIAYLRALLSVACDEVEIIDVHPFAKLKSLKEPKNPRKRFLQEDEYIRLRNSLREREDYLPIFIELGLNTGLRMNEMLTLSWDSIDFEKQSLLVASQFAKSKRYRTVPLNDTVVNMLREWKIRTQRFGPWVFTNPETGNHYVTIKRAWDGAMKKACIKDFVRQDLRRTFGSWLAERGESIYIIKNLLGHSSVQVTENHYAYLQDESQRNAVNKLVYHA